MSEERLSFFTLDPDGAYVPTKLARSAWAEHMLNGPAVVAAAARALEVAHGAPGFVPARLTVDLFSAVGFAPIRMRTEVVREGNRIRVCDVDLLQDEQDGADVSGSVSGSGAGKRVARATLVQLRTGEEPPGRTFTQGRRPPVPPAALEAEFGPGTHPAFGSGGEEPGWTSSMGPHQNDLRKRFWQHPVDVVAGEPASAFQRAATLAESTSLMTNWGTEGIGYINADLTLTLARLPESGDLGIEGDDHLASAGVAVGTATLYDRSGPFGSGSVVAVSNARRQIDFSDAAASAGRTRPDRLRGQQDS